MYRWGQERETVTDITDMDTPCRSSSPAQPTQADTPAPPIEDPVFSVVRINRPAPEPVLAVGGGLKSTICLLIDDQAMRSQLLGELSDVNDYRQFVATIDQFKANFRVNPKVVAYDMHPDYAATRYAQSLNLAEQGGTLVPVQHHVAHVASCMADNSLDGPVIGIACDGTGYGTDGAIWGCELFYSNQGNFQRVGHLRYFPLFGGDTAAQETWRPAAGLLHEVYGANWSREASFALQRVPNEAVRIADRRFVHSTRVPRTSSLGRLFDAVAFLLGICDYNEQEAQAAIALENLASQQDNVGPLRFQLDRSEVSPDAMQLDVQPMIRELVEQMKAGRPVGELARAFHETVIVMLADGATRAASEKDASQVVLSGGCFFNRILREGLTQRLTATGHQVFVHHQVSAGDEGVALGQAVVAAEQIRKGV